MDGLEVHLGEGGQLAITIWRFRGVGSGEREQPGGRVFIGSNDGKIYGQPPRDGDFPWVFATGRAVVSSPATIPARSCTVIVGSLDGNLYALDGVTRVPLWMMTAKAGLRASPLVIAEMTPTQGTKIVFGDLAGVLHALGANGNRLWATILDGPILGAAALLESPSTFHDPQERIYVGTQRGTLYGINPASGAVAFAKTLDGSCIVAAPVVSRVQTACQRFL